MNPGQGWRDCGAKLSEQGFLLLKKWEVFWLYDWCSWENSWECSEIADLRELALQTKIVDYPYYPRIFRQFWANPTHFPVIFPFKSFMNSGGKRWYWESRELWRWKWPKWHGSIRPLHDFFSMNWVLEFQRKQWFKKTNWEVRNKDPEEVRKKTSEIKRRKSADSGEDPAQKDSREKHFYVPRIKHRAQRANVEEKFLNISWEFVSTRISRALGYGNLYLK